MVISDERPHSCKQRPKVGVDGVDRVRVAQDGEEGVIRYVVESWEGLSPGQVGGAQHNPLCILG